MQCSGEIAISHTDELQVRAQSAVPYFTAIDSCILKCIAAHDFCKCALGFSRIGNFKHNFGGDKMTPLAHTRRIEKTLTQEGAMLVYTGKRLTTRITEHVQEKLQMAADLVGATMNQFVVQAALEKAERVIESESTIALTRRESLRLLELIENPPPRNEKFLEAMARYQRTKDNDISSTE